MKLAHVVQALEALSPPALAQSWDKVGLQVGDAEQDVTRGLLCIDLTPAVLEEAVRAGCALIVAYHPPIFAPLATLTQAHWKSRLLRSAVRQGIAIYTPHTALDACRGGVNDWLASGVGAGEVTPLQPVMASAGFKLVTFVPVAHEDALRDALARAGAGRIGAYSHCSFSVEGQGTFHGHADAGAEPVVGEADRLERVTERRLEMVCDGSNLPRVIEALRATHPYQEPAFDVVPLAPVAREGIGRVVELKQPVSGRTLARRVAKHLGMSRVTLVDGGASIRRVAVCAGAGHEVVATSGAEAWVTGEMRHHDLLEARERGVSVVLAGHTQTERPYLPVYRGLLRARTGRGVAWRVSRVDGPPEAVVECRA